MKKQTQNMEQISQADVDCIVMTGKDLKHISKVELVESLRTLTDANKEINHLKKHQLKDGYTAVPTEELGDCLEDAKTSIRQLRSVLSDEVPGYSKTQAIMDVLQQLTRIEAFCIGRCNAANPYAANSVCGLPEDY